MICTNNKINKTQLTVILINSVIGLEALSLPNRLANEVKTDGWIVILVAGLLAILLMSLINSVAVKYPGKSMVEFGRDLVPSPIANIISLIYMIEFLIIGGIIIKFFNEVMNIFLLNNTPFQVINITILLLAIYMVRSGIEAMGRFFIVATILLLLPTLVIGLSILPDINPDNFLPILNTDTSIMLKAIPKTISSFSGFQILFFITFMVKEDKKNLRKHHIISMIFIVILYTLIYLVTLGKYGANKLQYQIWPVMSLMRSIQIPSAFLENIDALVMSVWIIAVFTSLSVVLYGSSFIFSRLLKSNEMKPFVIPTAAIIYIIGSLPENLAQKIAYADKAIEITSLITLLIVPVLYFVLSKAKEKKKVKTVE